MARDIATPRAARFPKKAPKFKLEPAEIIAIPNIVKITVSVIRVVKGSFKKMRLIMRAQTGAVASKKTVAATDVKLNAIT